MKASGRMRPRRGSTVAATVVSGSLLLSALTPAATADPIDAYVQRYDTPMGSQIAKVEGAASPLLGQSPQVAHSPSPTSQVEGIDVSGWQRNVNWRYWWSKGKRFAYVKATEGTGYKNPYFAQQYHGSSRVGMIRGAYHFARPDRSSGSVQARYFATNGGGWSRDGKTLPGVVDLEWNPYGPACYGKSRAGMKAWIRAFHDTYQARTGRWPVIYTSTRWWSHCVGSGHGLEKTAPLWVARYSRSVGKLPPGWKSYTFWQYRTDPIDQNKFNGGDVQLKLFATI